MKQVRRRGQRPTFLGSQLFTLVVAFALDTGAGRSPTGGDAEFSFSTLAAPGSRGRPLLDVDSDSASLRPATTATWPDRRRGNVVPDVKSQAIPCQLTLVSAYYAIGYGESHPAVLKARPPRICFEAQEDVHATGLPVAKRSLCLYITNIVNEST